MASILDSTSNFIDLFKYFCGESECPPIYTHWSALSLIGGVLSNRVWVNKQIGAQFLPCYPNLYLLLLGPSANYKSHSMGTALRLIEETDYKPHLNLYSGKISAEALYNELKVTRKNPAAGHLYLLNDELAMCVGRGQNADGFIKSLTGLYHGARFRDRTRTFGSVILEAGYCVNWFGCTTEEWCVDCITRDAIQGGFFGRTNTVRAGYVERKVFDSVRPRDWEQVHQRLIARIGEMYGLAGEWKKTGRALQYERNWYLSRRAPEDPNILAVFKRERDMLVKLALIHAIADGSEVVEEVHMERADQSLSTTAEVIPELLGKMAMSATSRVMNDILDTIRISRMVQHSQLLKYAWKRGVNAERLRPEVATWEQAGLIEIVRRPKQGGGIVYKWRGPGKV